MQLRNALAIVLATSLLSVSSWASVCELSCSLSHGPGSKPTRASSATQANEVHTSGTNTPHSHCGHAKTVSPDNAANHSFENTSKCTNAPCTQAQSLSSPVNGRDGSQPGGVHFTVLASVPAVASNILFGSAKHERALTKLLSLDPLSVGLRI
jgi:hypothetical protein